MDHQIKNMLTDDRFRVFVDNLTSKLQSSHNGLLQRSVLVSILCLLLSNSCILKITLQLFLTQMLKLRKNFFSEWRLCLSSIKTEVPLLI